ncbi:MAG: hypothetical protein WCS99_15215 [Limisphaerales bacterium]
MAENIEFILQRAQATKAVQVSISASWVWEEKPVPQWDTSITALVTQMETTQDAEAEYLAKRGETYTAIDAIHTLSGRCLRMAKNRYRNDPAKLDVITRLRNNAGSYAGKLQDALEWESAWEKLDAAWSPLPGVTLATFKPQRIAALALLESLAGKKTDWDAADEQLNTQGRALNADNVAWYEAATTVFPAGTTEGDLIRSDIPTTYTPPSTPPTAIEIDQAIAQAGGKIAVTYVPGGGHDATSRRLEWQVVGVDAGFDHDVALKPVGQTLTGFTSGQTVNLRVKTSNPAGNTYSAVKTASTS